jgi:acyl dehydratase
MAVPRRHFVHQLPVVRALLETAVASSRPRPQEALTLPGPVLRATVSARPASLVKDYVRSVGGDPGAYRDTLPAHLFPQWGFPLLARTLRSIPYDLKRALNGGCRIEVHQPLPAHEALQLEAWIEHIDDNGSRAVVKNRLRTGTASAPAAMDAWMYAVVPLKKAEGRPERAKERPRVPATARELGWWNLSPQDAVDFAFLTGDFNPVHWLAPYARAAGFPSTILHGFATLARALEGLTRNRFAGDPQRLGVVDVKFVKPLVLPAEAGLYVQGHEMYVGTGPGGPAYLTGTFEEKGNG